MTEPGAGDATLLPPAAIWYGRERPIVGDCAWRGVIGLEESMTAIFPAPMLQQGADEEILLQMASVVFPGFLHRNPAGNGLQLHVEGDYKDPTRAKAAADQFQILLGALRAWRPMAGQREDEIQPGIGP